MSQVLVHKVTLSSGKTVILKDVELGDEELASQLASQKVAGENTIAFGTALIIELTKLLILQINDQKFTGAEKALAYKQLSYQEFAQVRSVVGKLISGGTAEAAPKLEIMTLNSGS